MLIDLEKNERINKIVVSCLDAKESWIHLPKKIIATVQDVTNQPHDIELTSLGDGIFFADNINRQVRKLRIKVEPINKIPEGLPGAGEKPWLFCSEIILE
jgi:hexosaminidase